MNVLSRCLGVSALAFLIGACGGSGRPPTAAGPAPTEESAETTGARPGVIDRSALGNVLAAGPGAFLRRYVELDVEHPVTLDGRFHGYRIALLRGNIWQGVDLAPGDIVTRVNGIVLEKPESALELFRSLRTANELVVSYERNGTPAELRFPIEGPPLPAEPPPEPRAEGPAKGVPDGKTPEGSAEESPTSVSATGAQSAPANPKPRAPKKPRK